MPAKNAIKQYVEGGCYHIYNRGVEKRIIFLDDQDYQVFLHFLKVLLSPPDNSLAHPLTEITGFTPVRLRPINDTLYKEVDLLAYCLMPNHFHLLIKQKTREGITKFMSRLAISYVMYFNKKYKRQGRLFQGIYKAAYIAEDPYLLHVSRYLHLNPSELTGMIPVREYPYSSYAYYLDKKQADWVKPELIIDYFKTAKRESLRDFSSYQSFVEDYPEDPYEILGVLALE